MRWLIFISVASVPLASMAAPSISSISGTFEQGESVTISGNSLGSNALVIEFLGEAIEAGTTGQAFARTGWNNNHGWVNAVYATDSAHSGDHSLKVSPTRPNDINGMFSYQLPDTVNEQENLYISYWIRKDDAYNGGQWKMLRISEIGDLDGDGNEIVFFNWNPYEGGGNKQLNIFGSKDPFTQAFWPEWYHYPIGDNNWARMDIYVQSSDLDQFDGSVTVTRYDGADINTFDTGDIRTHDTVDVGFDHVIFQNYIGPGIDTAHIWFDDIYIQQGSQARVELCDASTWGARTHCEIQKPTNWSTTSIDVDINQGTFNPDDTAYLYVIDDGDSVSSGYEVTIGGSGLAPPTQLIILNITGLGE